MSRSGRRPGPAPIPISDDDIYSDHYAEDEGGDERGAETPPLTEALAVLLSRLGAAEDLAPDPSAPDEDGGDAIRQMLLSRQALAAESQNPDHAATGVVPPRALPVTALTDEDAKAIFDEARNSFMRRSSEILLRAYGVICGMEDVNHYFERIGKQDAGFDAVGQRRIFQMTEKLVRLAVFEILTESLNAKESSNLLSRFLDLEFPVKRNERQQ